MKIGTHGFRLLITACTVQRHLVLKRIRGCGVGIGAKPVNFVQQHEKPIKYSNVFKPFHSAIAEHLRQTIFKIVGGSSENALISECAICVNEPSKPLGAFDLGVC